MTINEIRSKYLNFFENKGHKIIPPAPLVLQNDSTTLFTSSGMQPLVPYLMGQPHPEGRRVVDSQPSIRTQDIEEVGDNRHTTFFEMLGNWSFGDYFKKEQLPWIWEFITGELALPKEKLYVSVFQGNESVPKDTESLEIWKSLGIAGDHIFEYGDKKNWWSRSGTPDKMPVGEIGGPDSEIFFDFGQELGLHEKSEWKDEKCHPNCDCGRFLEIGNSVFIQYKKRQDGSLEELPQKNVDFGGGLERLSAATINNPDMFRIDIFGDVIDHIAKDIDKKYDEVKNSHSIRIIADHIRAAVFLIAGGVTPSNKQQGYILRRLLRRSILKAQQLRGDISQPLGEDFYNVIVDKYISKYAEVYPHLLEQQKFIYSVVADENEKFGKSLARGLREFEKSIGINGKVAFDLFQSHGFPFELTLELAQEKGQKVDVEEFKKEFEKHQEKSRTASAGTFKGGLADQSEKTTALHTATHLLHSALRKVVGDHVQQKGSNITSERLRFDFVHDAKLTDEQIKQITKLIDEQIDKDLEVTREEMTLSEAKEKGALAFFGEKYGDSVSVYSIGDFSKEVCGGPHVARLSALGGHVTITKQDNVGAGVRRVYAEIK